MFGIDGVLLALIITFIILFGAIMSGFPVAFAIGGAGVLAFFAAALLDSAGWLTHTLIDVSSPEYRELIASGVSRLDISKFTYPDLPRIVQPLFPEGWEKAVNRTLSFIVNRINERVIVGQSIETLLAILMFVLMGITLEKSNIANDLLTSMARVFGGLPGGLAVSVVVVGAFLAASTGIGCYDGAFVATNDASQRLFAKACHRCDCGFGNLGTDYPALDCDHHLGNFGGGFIFDGAGRTRPLGWV